MRRYYVSLDELPEINDFLNELIEQERVKDSALGICKQILDKGVESLSIKQINGFENYVLSEFNATMDGGPECARCLLNILWDQVIFAHDNGGFCSLCAHRMSKDNEKGK